MRRAVLMAMAAGAAAGVSGCVTAAVGAAAGVGAIVAQERSLGAALDDGAAATVLRARLMALDPRGFSDVSIEIVDGRLLLSGTAPSLDHRIDAERIAWTVEQVQAVANEIEVGGATGLLRTSLDEAVTLQVRSRLIASSDVRAVNVNIETSRGVVYLMGVARDEAEIRRAAEIASVTPGVRRVVVYMQTRPPRERIGPAVPTVDAQDQAQSHSGDWVGSERPPALAAEPPPPAPLLGPHLGPHAEPLGAPLALSGS